MNSGDWYFFGAAAQFRRAGHQDSDAFPRFGILLVGRNRIHFESTSQQAPWHNTHLGDNILALNFSQTTHLTSRPLQAQSVMSTSRAMTCADVRCFGERQANIDYHLEMARRCLGLSVSPLLSDEVDPLDAVEQPQHGSRIAAKIIHLRNLIATLTPVPTTTEADQCSVFDRFRASVETLWGDRRELGARDHTDTQPHLVRQPHHVDTPVSRRSLDLSSASASGHRRAGSSRI